VRDTVLREAGVGAPRCHFFNTFFMSKLLQLLKPPPKQGTYCYAEVRGGCT
jgi:hypothetical protein